MTRQARWVTHGLAAIYGGVLLCIGGVSKPVAFLFVGVGLIVGALGVLVEKEKKAPAHVARERPPAFRPGAGGRPR